MENRGRSFFVDWVIYFLGLLSVAALIYLFIGRYGTEIILSQKPKKIIEKNVGTGEKNSNALLPQRDNKDSSHRQQPTPKKSVKQQTKTKTKTASKVSSKKTQNKYRADLKKGNKRKISKSRKSGSTHRICVPSKPSRANYKKIRGFVLFDRPLRVKQSEYNWKVINRYPLKARKNLRKIGTYRVQKGDTVYSISRQFGVRAIDIMAINRGVKNPDKLTVRSKIFIPGF